MLRMSGTLDWWIGLGTLGESRHAVLTRQVSQTEVVQINVSRDSRGSV